MGPPHASELGLELSLMPQALPYYDITTDGSTLGVPSALPGQNRTVTAINSMLCLCTYFVMKNGQGYKTFHIKCSVITEKEMKTLPEIIYNFPSRR